MTRIKTLMRALGAAAALVAFAAPVSVSADWYEDDWYDYYDGYYDTVYDNNDWYYDYYDYDGYYDGY